MLNYGTGSQRRGQLFVSAVDQLRADADAHASLTIALWLVLKPKMAELKVLVADGILEGITASSVRNAMTSPAGAT